MAKLSNQQEELQKAFDVDNRDNIVSLLKNTERPGEIRDSDNKTLLHYAAIHGWTDVCQLLVEQYQVDPHVKSIVDGWTALHFAFYHNHTDTVKYLVSHAHCDPLIEGKYGDSAISYRGSFEESSSVPVYNRTKAGRSCTGQRHFVWTRKGLSSYKDSIPAPFMHRPDNDDISIDVDPSSLHPNSHYGVYIQVYSDTSNAGFTFPTGYEPISAVYKISIDAEDHPSAHTTTSSMVLQIMHFADRSESDSSQLVDHLEFVRSSDYFPSIFEIVSGESFKSNNPFGRIKILHGHTSFLAICRQKKDVVIPPLYRGVVLFTPKFCRPYIWLMHLLVTRYDPKQYFALNKHIRIKYGDGLTADFTVMHKEEFIFKFKSQMLKIIPSGEMESSHTYVKCKNGWILEMGVSEISQENADNFKAPHQLPGKCEMTIVTTKHTDQDKSSLSEDKWDLPMVKLSGIESSTTHIDLPKFSEWFQCTTEYGYGYDISAEVSHTSPSIHRPDYGISIDIDPASLHSDSHYVANIQVYFTDTSNAEFTFPTGYEPISAVYKISIDGDHPSTHCTTPSMVLKIMHFADPESGSSEQLNHLTFVKSSDRWSQFEIVQDGIFSNPRFGEIKLHHTSLWGICRRRIKDMISSPSYRGIVRYKQKLTANPNLWVMYLFVSRLEQTPFFALKKYIKNMNIMTGDGSLDDFDEPGFDFKFNTEKNKLEISIANETMGENRSVLCRESGWTLIMEVVEISKQSADDFNDEPHRIPGNCQVLIQMPQDASGAPVVLPSLEKLPVVKLEGIESSQRQISIVPPIPIEGTSTQLRSISPGANGNTGPRLRYTAENSASIQNTQPSTTSNSSNANSHDSSPSIELGVEAKVPLQNWFFSSKMKIPSLNWCTECVESWCQKFPKFCCALSCIIIVGLIVGIICIILYYVAMGYIHVRKEWRDMQNSTQ